MERYGLYALGIAIGALNGFNIGHAITQDSAQHDADARVAQVQISNEQIHQELAGTHQYIARLVLNDGEKSYSFQTANEQGQSERCTGKYQVRNNTATVVGNLACTLTVPATR